MYYDARAMLKGNMSIGCSRYPDFRQGAEVLLPAGLFEAVVNAAAFASAFFACFSQCSGPELANV